MTARQTTLLKQPHFVVGAGDLVSHIHRLETDFDHAQYHLNLFRVSSSGKVTSWLRPEDLRDIIKTCQVLAFSIADDGWVEAPLRGELAQPAGELQSVTDTWSKQNAED